MAKNRLEFGKNTKILFLIGLYFSVPNPSLFSSRQISEAGTKELGTTIRKASAPKAQTSEAKSPFASEPHYTPDGNPALQKIRKETWSESEE